MASLARLPRSYQGPGRRVRAGPGPSGDSVTSGGGLRRGIPGLYQERSTWGDNGKQPWGEATLGSTPREPHKKILT